MARLALLFALATVALATSSGLVVDYVSGPPTNGGTLFVYGDNFGSVSLSIDGVDCHELSIVSTSELRCPTVAPGSGKEHSLVITDTETGEAVEAQWSYLAPLIASVSPKSGSTHPNGEKLIVKGWNLGSVDTKVQVMVGDFLAADCAVTMENEEVSCSERPSGFGLELPITVVVDGVEGTSTEGLFTFDSPSINSISSPNEEGEIVVRGLNFGPKRHLQKNEHDTIFVDGEACAGNVRVTEDHYEIRCSSKRDSTKHMDVEFRTQGTEYFHMDKPEVHSIHPSHVDTEGEFNPTIRGKHFGHPGSDVIVRIGGKEVPHCVVRSHDKIECSHRTPGVGQDLDVTVERYGVVGLKRHAFSYGKPEVHRVDKAPTSGGDIRIEGKNFGPAGTVLDVTIDGQPCVYHSSDHHEINCKVLPGVGDHHQVKVCYWVNGKESCSQHNDKFSYYAPKIHKVSPIHATGGDIVIEGANFGNRPQAIKVKVGGKKCERPHLDEAHRRIVCTIEGGKPGHYDNVQIRVGGQTSVNKGHVEFKNQGPYFDRHHGKYEVTIGDSLYIELPAIDPDNDKLKFRVHGLPDGAHTSTHDNVLRIQYFPSDHKNELAQRREEKIHKISVSVTDGWETASTTLDIITQICPRGWDTCRDKTCVPKGAICPFCAVSDYPRCPTGLPLMLGDSGECHGYDYLEGHGRLAADHPVHVGVTVDLTEEATIPLFSANLDRSGYVQLPASTLQKSEDDDLTCFEAVPYDAHGVDIIASPAVQLISGVANDTFAKAALIALVPYGQRFKKFTQRHHVDVHSLADDDDDDGNQRHNHVDDDDHEHLSETYTTSYVHYQQFDPYGLCLGRLSECTGKWECEDEHLEWAYGYVQGKTYRDGIYALIYDNCPGAYNPEQHDRDGDGVGDECDNKACCGYGVDRINKKFISSAVQGMYEDAYYGMKPYNFNADSCEPNYIHSEVPPLPQ